MLICIICDFLDKEIFFGWSFLSAKVCLNEKVSFYGRKINKIRVSEDIGRLKQLFMILLHIHWAKMYKSNWEIQKKWIYDCKFIDLRDNQRKIPFDLKRK